MPGDPTQGGTSCSDLNQIPSDLVERVDLLTGGASAVYGADATAGVVNFVMNDHFEGVRLVAGDGYYNHSQHNAGAVEHSLDRFGRLDIVVVNAGILMGGTIDAFSLTDFDKMVAVNVRGVFAAPHFAATGRSKSPARRRRGRRSSSAANRADLAP